MRIGLIVAGGVDRSGRERVLPELLDFIGRVAARHKLHVFVLQYYAEPCEYSLRGATIHDLGRVAWPRGLRTWRMRARLRAAIARVGRFDVLHAYWGMPTGVVAVDVGGALGIPTIVTLTTGELIGIPDIGYGLQRRARDRRAIARVFHRAAQVTVPTEYMRRLAEAAYGARPAVVPMGLDRDRLTPLPAGDGPPWRLLRVGTINRVKDYPLLLHALVRVLQAEPQTHLDIVGEDTLRGSIRALADRVSVAHAVTFHGYQPMDVVPSFHQRAHLHLVSSRHEASSVTTLEAALSGVATVGTAVGHLADWAALEPPAAATVPVGDVEGFAAAIIELLRDPPRRQALAGAARSWALAHDADWTAATFEALYARVAAEAR